MTTEWRDITDPKELFSLDLSEWEIHRYHDRTEEWYGWHGSDWQYNQRFRARPRQPKKRVVKSLCWRNKLDGTVDWASDDIGFNSSSEWQRFPAGDIEGEVEDDN